MTGVLIGTGDADKKMRKALPCLLQNGFVTSTMWDTPPTDAHRPELLVGDIADICTQKMDEAVLIFKAPVALPRELPAAERTVVVVDASAGAGLLEHVSKTMLPAITCGLSPRDTLTLSSIGTDSAVVTLQRTLTCFDGGTVEPQEIPIELSAPTDSFLLMAAAAVYLLRGRADRLRGAVLGPETF